MSILVILVLALTIVAPIAWLVSEFKVKKRSIRVSLGILAILCSFGVAWVAGQFERLNYNAWYGFASKRLIDTTISQLEKGNGDLVLKELEQLQKDFRPTYENRAHYNDLVEESVKRMEKGTANKSGLEQSAMPPSSP